MAANRVASRRRHGISRVMTPANQQRLPKPKHGVSPVILLPLVSPKAKARQSLSIGTTHPMRSAKSPRQTAARQRSKASQRALHQRIMMVLSRPPRSTANLRVPILQVREQIAHTKASPLVVNQQPVSRQQASHRARKTARVRPRRRLRAETIRPATALRSQTAKQTLVITSGAMRPT